MWGDTILIVFISVCTALLGEGLTWLLVYRTDKYQKLKGEVEKQSKKFAQKYIPIFNTQKLLCYLRNACTQLEEK